MKRRKTLSVAFSGISVAIIIILFFLSSIIDVLDYTACAFAGIFITFVLIEFGNSYAISVYFASSILALLIVPSKLTPILFVAFCGWYPFLKRSLEKLKEPLSTILKFFFFNVALTVIVFLTKEFFVLEYVTAIFYVAVYLISNFTFFVYDMLITRLIWLYVHKYKKKFRFLK